MSIHTIMLDFRKWKKIEIYYIKNKMLQKCLFLYLFDVYNIKLSSYVRKIREMCKIVIAMIERQKQLAVKILQSIL
jgi:hypothetical protein